jgi:ariadne-1
MRISARVLPQNCENAIECLVDRGPSEPLDVICACAAAFCFNCKEEAHRPVRGEGL